MQSIIDGCNAGKINAQVCAVISNNSKSGAMERARNANIPAFHFSAKTHPDAEKLVATILRTLQDYDTDIIFLAGYMKKIDPSILYAYKDRIFNIHPSLLPKFGGKGMFGINVHQAVIDAGETETGVTIHKVDPEYDTGEYVAQRTVPVHPNDTAETLAARVLEAEHEFLVEVLGGICAE